MKNRSTALVIAVVAVIGLLVVIAATQRQDADSPAAPAASVNDGPARTDAGDSQGASDSPLARRIDGDPFAVGAIDAPVVMIEYADFRCPFCGVFARDVKPQLQSYIDDGTLRVEWRDFPVFGEQSMAGALAGRAAAKQGRFWQWYEVVFANAPARGHLDLDEEKITKFADEAGIPDMKTFHADRKDPELAQDVQHDLNEARSIGATGTPTFVINDEAVVGAQPMEVFTEKIDRMAAEHPS